MSGTHAQAVIYETVENSGGYTTPPPQFTSRIADTQRGYMSRLPRLLVLFALTAGCGAHPVGPTSPSHLAGTTTLPGGIVLLAPYTTVSLPIGTVVRPNLDPVNLTPQHAAMAPFVTIEGSPNLLKLATGDFQIVALGQAGIFVCGVHCGSPPMPIIFLITPTP